MLNVTRRWTRGRQFAAATCRYLTLRLGRSLKATRAAHAGYCAVILPILAQAQKTAAPEAPAAEGGSWQVVDWLIVVVLVGGALFAICRSSRRN
jgi:hypothetical protein